MSWWTDARDGWEKVSTFGLYDPKASRQAAANARYALNDQIKAYKDQTELTNQATQKVRAEQDVQARRIQEKQIRTLRRTYRPQSVGILGVGEAATQDMDNKLGG